MIRRWLRRSSLEQNMALSTGLLVVVLVGTTLLLVQRRFVITMEGELEARGRSMAASIGAVATPSLLAYNYTALQLAAERAAADDGVLYVIIHDKEGSVAGASGPAVASPSGARAVEVAVPVHVPDVAEPWGLVRVGLSRDSIADELRTLGLGLLVLGLALAMLASVAAGWMARRITAPLRGLVRGTEALSAGDIEHRIPVTGPHELAELARSFNAMMDRVQEKRRESLSLQAALASLNATLEQQVRERTAAFEESQAQYKTLVEHSPDGILIVQDSQVRFTNDAFLQAFDLDRREVLAPGFSLDVLFEPAAARLVRGRIAAWEEDRPAGPVEVVATGRRGVARHIELRGSRIEYRGGPAVECLLIDTSEAKRLRERLGETEKLRALGELASGVAHDFNNLLGAILGRAQLLKRRQLGADVERDLAVVERAAQDGRETVRRIQEFALTRRDRQFQPVDLSGVLADAVEMTRGRWKTEAEARGLPLVLETALAPVPAILGNAPELREVFTNLILNAVDAMPQGGVLSVSCTISGGEVAAEVRDTGVGMTDEVRRHMFDPFFTTKGSRGMGLGMSVVYGIVTRHAGSIDIETEPGRGTSFRLRFAAIDADQATALAQVRPPAPVEHAASGRILVIDDEQDLVDVLRDVLEAAGHVVDTALGGREGVELVRASGYDLVFTDLGMPDVSGWDVAEQVRTLSPGTSVVLVTGWGATLDEDEARRRGIETIVHKPFEIDELVRTTSQLLSRAKTA